MYVAAVSVSAGVMLFLNNFNVQSCGATLLRKLFKIRPSPAFGTSSAMGLLGEVEKLPQKALG